jgi:hypothetical protein
MKHDIRINHVHCSCKRQSLQSMYRHLLLEEDNSVKEPKDHFFDSEDRAERKHAKRKNATITKIGAPCKGIKPIRPSVSFGSINCILHGFRNTFLLRIPMALRITLGTRLILHRYIVARINSSCKELHLPDIQ